MRRKRTEEEERRIVSYSRCIDSDYRAGPWEVDDEEHKVPEWLLAQFPKEELYNRLQQGMFDCRRCMLCKERNSMVWGEGPLDASVMLIGEAPGDGEDKSGKPFVGRAGQLLDKIMDFADLSRETNTFITNSVLCRPPNNRNPLFHDEVFFCNHRLLTQIRIIQPKIIVAMGRIAMQALFNCQECPGSIAEWERVAREKHFKLQMGTYSADIYITYHPSYLLRKASEQEKAVKHWANIRDRLSVLSKEKT